MPKGGQTAVYARRIKLEQRRKEQAAEVEKWFVMLNKDESGLLEPDELRKLLIYLNPGREPTQEMIEHLCEQATAVNNFSCSFAGDKDGAVTRAQVRQVVNSYRDYLGQQEYIDKVFLKHDVDDSGMLDQSELLALMSELVPDAETDQEDVDFILEQCDVNGDQEVNRRELLPLLGVWMILGADKAATLAEARRKAEEELKERTAEGASEEPSSRGPILDAMAKRPVIAAVKEASKLISNELLPPEEAEAPAVEESGRYDKEARKKSQEIMKKKNSFTGPAAVTGTDGNMQVISSKPSLNSPTQSPRSGNPAGSTDADAAGDSSAAKKSSMCAVL